jgi:hypothetical protein
MGMGREARGGTFSSWVLALRTIVTAPAVARTMPVKSLRRKASWNTTGAMTALQRIAIVPNGATILAGANPSAVSETRGEKALEEMRSLTRGTLKQTVRGNRGSTRNEIARLSNHHQYQSSPPQRRMQIPCPLVIVLISSPSRSTITNPRTRRSAGIGL